MEPNSYSISAQNPFPSQQKMSQTSYYNNPLPPQHSSTQPPMSQNACYYNNNLPPQPPMQQGYFPNQQQQQCLPQSIIRQYSTCNNNLSHQAYIVNCPSQHIQNFDYSSINNPSMPVNNVNFVANQNGYYRGNAPPISSNDANLSENRSVQLPSVQSFGSVEQAESNQKKQKAPEQLERDKVGQALNRDKSKEYVAYLECKKKYYKENNKDLTSVIHMLEDIIEKMINSIPGNASVLERYFVEHPELLSKNTEQTPTSLE